MNPKEAAIGTQSMWPDLRLAAVDTAETAITAARPTKARMIVTRHRAHRIPPAAPTTIPELISHKTRSRTIRIMHEDDTLSRFHGARPGAAGIEPLDGFVLVEPVDDETETGAGLIIPASAESGCAAAVVVAIGEDVHGVAPGDKVLYPRGAGFELRVGGESKRLIDRRELIARIAD